jgi:hypothetical protein
MPRHHDTAAIVLIPMALLRLLIRKKAGAAQPNA